MAAAKGQIDLSFEEATTSAKRMVSAVRARRVDSIIHNLNSVLQIVSGHASLIEQAYPEEARCSKLRAGVQRLGSLVNQLKQGAGATHDVKAVATETCALFDMLCTSNTRPTWRVSGEALTVNASAARVCEAFLISLLDQMPIDAELHIEIDAKATCLRLQVSELPPIAVDQDLGHLLSVCGVLWQEQEAIGGKVNGLHLAFQSAAFEGI